MQNVKINLTATKTFPSGIEFNLNQNEISFPISQPFGAYKPEPVIIKFHTSSRNENLLRLAENSMARKNKSPSGDQIELLVSEEHGEKYKFKNGVVMRHYGHLKKSVVTRQSLIINSLNLYIFFRKKNKPTCFKNYH